MKQASDLLTMWFAGVDQPDTAPLMKRWFGSDPQSDAQLQRDFGPLLAEAEAGGLQSWEAEPESMLALVVLLDQFSRNLHRGSGQAFANDPRARDLAAQAIEKGWDQRFSPLERMFFYLPFEHSESLADQNRCVELFEALNREQSNDFFANTLDYARRHRDVIARFGRFPHRNQRLGRSSTPAEEAFLQTPGSSFG